ncbi:Cu(I)-responsive transcriptional regulator [Vibrio cionasavignyae]|uniref:Cu(I)-responsive transcriptional regulator n=1 Tax=Vibrio cionasavignyae TaxID=2910252 RepID=UPI003D12066A
MNISEVAGATGLTAKSIRLYEERKLISEPSRAENGYRQYNQRHIDELTVIARARAVGFSLDECRELVELAFSCQRMSESVKNTTIKKREEIQQKIKALQQMEQQLTQWIDKCPGDTQSKCPIIDGLKGEE